MIKLLIISGIIIAVAFVFFWNPWFFKEKGLESESDAGLKEALVIAQREIDKNASRAPKLFIYKREKHPEGWLFYYQTEKYVKTKNINDSVPGAWPILVRDDGTTMIMNPIIETTEE